MADESNNLRETLARLHDQLRGAPNVNPETRTALQDLLAEIRGLLETGSTHDASAAGGTSRAKQHESIVTRLGTAEREFEATHPTLAGIVGSIIDALGRMGI
jgi:hypothetical protein